jgi:hypothetical protein
VWGEDAALTGPDGYQLLTLSDVDILLIGYLIACISIV